MPRNEDDRCTFSEMGLPPRASSVDAFDTQHENPELIRCVVATICERLANTEDMTPTWLNEHELYSMAKGMDQEHDEIPWLTPTPEEELARLAITISKSPPSMNAFSSDCLETPAKCEFKDTRCGNTTVGLLPRSKFAQQRRKTSGPSKCRIHRTRQMAGRIPKTHAMTTRSQSRHERTKTGKKHML